MRRGGGAIMRRVAAIVALSLLNYYAISIRRHCSTFELKNILKIEMWRRIARFFDEILHIRRAAQTWQAMGRESPIWLVAALALTCPCVIASKAKQSNVSSVQDV